MNGSSVQVFLDHPGCLDNICQTSIDDVISEDVLVDRLYFGRVDEKTNTSDVSSPDSKTFVGCIDEVKVDGTWATEDGRGVLYSRVAKGCNRTLQCDGRCLNGGLCTDLWNDFNCECLRPYYGTTCSKAVDATTFGHDSKPSFVIFNLMDVYTISDLGKGLDVSIFFRSRERNGFLFFIQLQDGIEAPTRFLGCEIVNGTFVVQGKLLESSQDLDILQFKGFDKVGSFMFLMNFTIEEPC